MWPLPGGKRMKPRKSPKKPEKARKSPEKPGKSLTNHLLTMSDGTINTISRDSGDLPAVIAARFEARRKLQDEAISENTKRNYRCAMQRFINWLEGAGKDLEGLNPDDLLSYYLASLDAAGKSAAVAAQAVAAVRAYAAEANEPDPAGKETRKTLRGIRRRSARQKRGRGQVKGLTWAVVEKMIDCQVEIGTLTGARNAAIISTMSDGLLRISEVAALQASDFEAQTDGTGRLEIRWSKTDQEGKGEVQFLGPRTVDLVERWMLDADIEEGSEGPLFRRIWRGEHIRQEGISSRTAARAIQKAAQLAGVKGYVGGHSLRVGTAQSLARRGAGLVAMQNAGRWSSPSMPGHYARAEFAARGAVARFKYDLAER